MKNVLSIILFLVTASMGFSQGQTFPDIKPYSSETPAKEAKDISLEEALEGSRILYGRFLQVDRYAEKYPTMSPYVGMGNNPVFFIDPTGDSLDVSGLHKTDRIRLQASLDRVGISSTVTKSGMLLVDVKNALSSALGNVLDILSGNKKSNVSIVINPNLLADASFEANSNKRNSGGTLSLKSPDDIAKSEGAHELFHGFQNMVKGGRNNFETEVEAYLFADVVHNQLGGYSGKGMPDLWNFDRNRRSQFEKNYERIFRTLYNGRFNPSGYSNLVNSFNQTDLYKQYVRLLGPKSYLFRAPKVVNPVIQGIIR